jgi:hypothetical protein
MEASLLEILGKDNVIPAKEYGGYPGTVRLKSVTLDVPVKATNFEANEFIKNITKYFLDIDANQLSAIIKLPRKDD